MYSDIAAIALTTELMEEALREVGIHPRDCNVGPRMLPNNPEVIDLITDFKYCKIGEKEFLTIFKGLLKHTRNVEKIIRPTIEVFDNSNLDTTIENVIMEYPTEYKRFIEGEDKLLKHLIGLVMKKQKGLNPRDVKTYLENRKNG